MRSPGFPDLTGLPADAVVERGPRGVSAVRAEVASAFRAAGWDAAGGGVLVAGDLAGRRPLRELVVGEERFPVREFHHGGLLRRLTGRRYADPARPFRELAFQERLARSGVPTVEVLAARARRAPLGGWWLELVTRRVPRAVDGGEALERVRAGELDEAQRRALFRATGELARRLHALGFLHADLQPRNLLFDSEQLAAAEPRARVLDLDGSRFEAELTELERDDNLRRLWRSVERREARGAAFLRRTDLARFLFAYESDRVRAKALWRRIAAAHAAARARHGLGWALEQLFGARVADRDGSACVRDAHTS